MNRLIVKLNDMLMEESRDCMEQGAHLLTLDSHFSAIEGLLLADLLGPEFTHYAHLPHML